MADISDPSKPAADPAQTTTEAPPAALEKQPPPPGGEEIIQSEATVEKSHKKLYICVIILLLALATGGGFFFLQSQQQSQEPSTSKNEEQEPTPVPTKDIKESINRSKYTFEVLNGSGVAGAAAALAAKLEARGFTIVEIGNADTQDYEATLLFLSADVRDTSSLLLEDLKDEVNIATVAGELEDSTASARIIIGKNE